MGGFYKDFNMKIKRVNYRYILVANQNQHYLVDTYNGLGKTLYFLLKWRNPIQAMSIDEQLYSEIANRKKSWVERFTLTFPMIVLLSLLFRYPLSRTPLPAYVYNETSFVMSILLVCLVFGVVLFSTHLFYWNSQSSLFRQFPKLKDLSRVESVILTPIFDRVVRDQIVTLTLIWFTVLLLIALYFIFKTYLFLFFIFAGLFLLIPIANSGAYNENAKYSIESQQRRK